MCRGCAGIGSKRRSIVRPRKSFASLWLSGTRSVASFCTRKPFPIKHAAPCLGSKAQRTKNPKIQNLSEARNFWIFGFPYVFLVFPQKSQKNIVFLVFQQKSKKPKFFLFFTRDLTKKPKKSRVVLVFHLKCKKHRFFGFSPETEQENQKSLCFLFSAQNPQKPCDFFGFLLENQKNTRKTKQKQKFRAPQKDFGFLFFWFPPS